MASADEFPIFGGGVYTGESLTVLRDTLGRSDGSDRLPTNMQLDCDRVVPLSENKALLAVTSMEVQQGVIYNEPGSELYEESKIQMQRELCRRLGLPSELGLFIDLEGESDVDKDILVFFEEEVDRDIDHVAQGTALFDTRFRRVHNLVADKLGNDPEGLDEYLTKVIAAKDTWAHRSRVIGRALVSGKLHPELPSAEMIQPLMVDALVDTGLPRVIAEVCSGEWPHVTKLLALTSLNKPSTAQKAKIVDYKQKLFERATWVLQTSTEKPEVNSAIDNEISRLEERIASLRGVQAAINLT